MPHNKLSIVFVLFFLYLLILPSKTNAQIPACKGAEAKGIPVTQTDSAQACPEGTCFVEDIRDTGTLYRCYNPPVEGTCSWDVGPPIMVNNNDCKEGYSPHLEGSDFFPSCVCKPLGAPREVPSTLTPGTPGVNKPGEQTGPQCVRKGEDNPNDLPICSTSAGDECAGGKGLNTALGCINTDPAAFINELLRFVAGISGGIALLLMIFGSIRMMTSSGDAESLKAGREQFSSAVIGLLFIIFSVLLLQIIGVDILKIPGLEP